MTRQKKVEAWLRRKYVVRRSRGIDYLTAAVDDLAREIVLADRVDERRVRTLVAARHLVDKVPVEYLKATIIDQLGHELSKKLAEFQKFRRVGDLIVAEVDVIVPQTPDDKWPVD